MNKIYPSAEAALAGVVADGQTLAVGGFGQRWRHSATVYCISVRAKPRPR